MRPFTLRRITGALVETALKSEIRTSARVGKWVQWRPSVSVDAGPLFCGATGSSEHVKSLLRGERPGESEEDPGTGGVGKHKDDGKTRTARGSVATSDIRVDTSGAASLSARDLPL